MKKAYPKVELLSVYGDELSIVNSARVSFNKQKFTFDEKDERLIRYLLKHDHWTPFSHALLRLRIHAPIFVAREWFRHVVGVTRNEVSRRYVTDEPLFYMPDYFRIKSKDKKQGSIDQVNSKDHIFKLRYKRFLKRAKDLYNEMLNADIPPEQARMILPQSMITTWIETGSLYFYLRVISLRCKEDAQKEIRIIAFDVKDILTKHFPHVMSAYEDIEKAKVNMNEK